MVIIAKLIRNNRQKYVWIKRWEQTLWFLNLLLADSLILSSTLHRVSSYVVIFQFSSFCVYLFFHPSWFAPHLLALASYIPLFFIISSIAESHVFVGRPPLPLFLWLSFPNSIYLSIVVHFLKISPPVYLSFFYKVFDRLYI